MNQLDKDIRAANEKGVSYGQYKAMTYNPAATMAAPSKKKKHKRPPRRFSDEQAFSLWQTGMSDPRIAEELGVTRQCIQRWRTQLELPLLSREYVDTQKYRLAKMPDGTCVVIKKDCEL